jgi:dodecin
MTDSVYKVIELVGSSEIGWEDAARNAIAQAAKTIRDIRICEVLELDTKLNDNQIVAFRARVKISFKYEE